MQNPNLGRSENSITSVETRLAEDPREADQNLEEGRYVGSTHWSAILDDIHELKAAVARRQDAPEPETMPQSPGPSKESIIFGSPSDYPLEQAMGHHLPSKVEADRLVAIYFRGENFIIPFIRTVQFQRQYRDFYADPSHVNLLWLSMLFLDLLGVYLNPRHGGYLLDVKRGCHCRRQPIPCSIWEMLGSR